MVVVGVIEVLKCPKSHMGFPCGSTLEEVKGRLSQVGGGEGLSDSFLG